jgi:hypothetical protein
VRRAVFVAALALSFAGCTHSESDRVEDALRDYAETEMEIGPDPPSETRIESVECDEYEGERFREAQVFACEVAASNQTIADLCVALVEEDLYFATGKYDCLEDGFARSP